jgi:hypothetical protein
MSEPQLGQRGDASRLEELADDPVGLGKVPLEKEDLAPRIGKTVGERAARDAGSDDNNLGLDVVKLDNISKA